MGTLKILFTLGLTSVRSRMEYKSSFLFYIFAILVFYVGQVGLLLVILARFHEIQGWDLGQMAFLFSLLAFAQGISNLFFSSLHNFDQMIIKGEFDRYLVRPLSPFGQVIVSKFEASTLAHLFIGCIALYIGSEMAEINWTWKKALYFPLVIAGGVMISGAIRLAVTSVAFWTLRNSSLVHTIVFSSREFVIYPVTIYNWGVQFFLTFVFPIAFINFYPAHYFLDRTGEGLLHPALQMGTPIVGLVLFALSIYSWKAGIDHYQSSGS